MVLYFNFHILLLPSLSSIDQSSLTRVVHLPPYDCMNDHSPIALHASVNSIWPHRIATTPVSCLRTEDTHWPSQARRSSRRRRNGPSDTPQYDSEVKSSLRSPLTAVSLWCFKSSAHNILGTAQSRLLELLFRVSIPWKCKTKHSRRNETGEEPS